MPRAEVGSTKHLANKMKAKGLQRLRWYCQVCERQMRDANGFKQHTMSEGHVRNMLLVGENSGKVIADYTAQFQRDFLTLLRTSHGEKLINLNHFYNEYIRNKEHIHMNATRYASLTEFGKHLGRSGICRIEEGERGLEIAWIDSSPEALRRQDAIRKKERQDKGDEEREQRQIADQVARAQRDADIKAAPEPTDEANLLQREDGEKLTLDFGKKTAPEKFTSAPAVASTEPSAPSEPSIPSTHSAPSTTDTYTKTNPQPPTISTGSIALGPKPKNVFSQSSKNNPLGGKKAAPKVVVAKPMSEAERIMKEELQRKRMRESHGTQGPPMKRVK